MHFHVTYTRRGVYAAVTATGTIDYRRARLVAWLLCSPIMLSERRKIKKSGLMIKENI